MSWSARAPGVRLRRWRALTKCALLLSRRRIATQPFPMCRRPARLVFRACKFCSGQFVRPAGLARQCRADAGSGGGRGQQGSEIHRHARSTSASCRTTIQPRNSKISWSRSETTFRRSGQTKRASWGLKNARRRCNADRAGSAGRAFPPSVTSLPKRKRIHRMVQSRTHARTACWVCPASSAVAALSR